MVRIFTRNLVAIEYRNLVLAASHHLLVILLPVSRDIGLLRLPEQNNRPRGFLGGSDRKESVCNAGDLGLVPGLGRSPRRRVWQLTPVSLPGKVHGQRSLAGYSPRGHKELDMTELLTHGERFKQQLMFAFSHFWRLEVPGQDLVSAVGEDAPLSLQTQRFSTCRERESTHALVTLIRTLALWDQGNSFKIK